MRRLAVIGSGLLLAGVGWFVVLVVIGLDYDWGDAYVEANGESHVVEVDAGRDAMVWHYEATGALDCEIRDGDGSGEVLVQHPTDGAYRRDGGSAGDYVGTHVVRPTQAVVTVTCEDVRPAASSAGIAVEPAPRLPWWLFYGTAAPHGPFALFGLGALIAGAAGLRWTWDVIRTAGNNRPSV